MYEILARTEMYVYVWLGENSYCLVFKLMHIHLGEL